jgi:SET domain-containing protein
LEIKESLIPGAGLGLFAKSHIAKGSVFCEYYGRELTLLQTIKLKDKTYLMGGFGLNCHIDAKDELGCFGRYINDAMDPAKQNARFVKIKHLKKANVIAIKDVQAGDEIYASYGNVYWRGKERESNASHVPVDQIAEFSCFFICKHPKCDWWYRTIRRG